MVQPVCGNFSEDFKADIKDTNGSILLNPSSVSHFQDKGDDPKI